MSKLEVIAPRPGVAPTNAPVEAVEHGLRVLLILSALLAFASISTDLYLPAMPVMATSLHANSGMMELTVSGYLAGFSLGQLFWGPFSDRFGRRLPVALGLVLAVCGLGCLLSAAWVLSAPDES